MSIKISPITGLSLQDAMVRAEAGEQIMIVTHEILEREIRRIADEAWSMQMNTRSSAPTAADLQEKQAVPASIGGSNYIYILKDGVPLRWQIT